jgi:Tfp pilus assembly PilM family ATPase
MIIGWPFSNLNVDRKLLGAASLQDTAPMMAVSIGLALRGVDEL